MGQLLEAAGLIVLGMICFGGLAAAWLYFNVKKRMVSDTTAPDSSCPNGSGPVQ